MHHIEASDGVVAFAVALPVIAFLLLVWALHAPLVPSPAARLGAVVVACGVLAALAGAAAGGLSLPWFTVAAALPVWALVALAVFLDDRQARSATGPGLTGSAG